MKQPTIALTNFRSNLYGLVDQVLASGEPLLLERHGRVLEVRERPVKKKASKPAKKYRDLSTIKPLSIMTEDPDWYISPKLHEWSEDRESNLH